MIVNRDARPARLVLPLVLAGAIGLSACTSAPPAPPAPAPPPAAATASASAPASAAAIAPAELTCGGEGTDPAAKIRYGSEVTIAAPLEVVWALQTDIEGWKRWQAAISTIDRIDDGPLRAGSQFRWTTPVPATPISPASVLDITSTLGAVEEESCLRWSGPAKSEGLNIDEGTHVWTFAEEGGGVRVRTEETWVGPQVETDVALSTAALGGGLEAWLAELKATAEKTATPGG